jgi:nitrogen regulatory protein PII-like uncharacterized protein
MKNIFFSIITLVLTSNFVIAQNTVKFINFQGKELGIAINIKSDNSFTEYYLFQSDYQDYSKLSGFDNFKLVEATKDHIKVSSDDSIFTFTIEETEKKENIFLGFGLSKRSGEFKLVENSDAEDFMDLILTNNQVNRGSLTCHSGGEGATECSVTPSDVNVGASSCSVSCGRGYYACCDDTRGECKCKANKKKNLTTN